MGGFRKDLFTVPNTMSLFRVVAAPLLAFFWLGMEWRALTLALGTLIGITDQLDGWVARKLNQITELGALLDQLGDLVFESTCLLIAVLIGELWSGWLVIYLFREFTVNVVRSYVIRRGGTLPSSLLGKTKSSIIQYAFFMFFLGGNLIQPGVVPESWSLVGVSPGRFLLTFGQVSIHFGIVLSLISGWIYLRGFARFYAAQTVRKEQG